MRVFNKLDVIDRIIKINESNNIIDDNTINGKCSNCGECCSNYLRLSKSEIKKIHEYIRRNNIPNKHSYVLGMSYAIDITCPFRDKVNKKCTIYQVRPQICKDFICNKSIDEILERRSYYENKYEVTDMRMEFFGEDVFKLCYNN